LSLTGHSIQREPFVPDAPFEAIAKEAVGVGRPRAPKQEAGGGQRIDEARNGRADAASRTPSQQILPRHR